LHPRKLRQIEAEIKQIDQKHEENIQAIEIDNKKALTEAESDFEKTQKQTQDNIAALNKDNGIVGVPWHDPLWKSWEQENNTVVSPYLRIGDFIEQGKEHTLIMPALVPVIGKGNVIIKCPGKANAQAVQIISNMVLRMISTISPGKLRFTFIDPVGLGQSMAAFMLLNDYDDGLTTGGRIWTESRDIEVQLTNLTIHMEQVFQKYLRNKHQTIESYNVENGEVAEPYKMLVINPFPGNFTEDAIQRLESIVLNGPRCGVYTILAINTDKNAQTAPFWQRMMSTIKNDIFQLEDLEQGATVLSWDGERFVYNDNDFKDCQLDLDLLPSNEILELVLKKFGGQVKKASVVEVRFESKREIAIPENQWWQEDSSYGLKIPLGPNVSGKIQYLELGKDTSHHVLIVGKTGSGKSNLLHVIIMSTFVNYSPQEVEVYLIDFKQGVEFEPYATQQAPHVRVVAIYSEREYGLSILQRLDREIVERGKLFLKVGASDIKEYRNATKKYLPRILLIVDEFHTFFTEDDLVGAQSAQILDKLVREGRAFGINIILSSQTLAGTYNLSRSTIDQMAVRIALQCSESDSRLILAEDNPAAQNLSRKGEAIYNSANGRGEGNSRFQTVIIG
jgi:hypothetical protein